MLIILGLNVIHELYEQLFWLPSTNSVDCIRKSQHQKSDSPSTSTGNNNEERGDEMSFKRARHV